MPILSGITDIGTVWIKKVDRRGNLIQKRVQKNGIQYDTFFRQKDGKPKITLRTNLHKNQQIVYVYSNNKRAANVENVKNKSLAGRLYVKYLQKVSGFLNKNFNNITENLLAKHLEKMEEILL